MEFTERAARNSNGDVSGNRSHANTTIDSPSKRSMILKEDGNDLFKQNRFSEAIQKYSEAIELNKNETGFFFNRSLCYSALGLRTKAIEDARQCIKLNNKYMKGYYRAAIALQANSEYEKALEVAKDGLNFFPENTDLSRLSEKLSSQLLIYQWKSKADFHFSRDEFPLAIEEYAKCILINENEPSELTLKCVSNRALCRMHIGDHKGTIEDCSFVLRFRTNDIKALIRRSQALEASGDLESALSDVSAVMAMSETTVGSRIRTLAQELQRRLERLIEERDSPTHLLRKASVDECSGKNCFCLEPMMPGFNTVRLRCRCVLHEHCIVSYVRSKLGDKSSVCDRGVPCPNGCGGYVWIDDVDALCALSTQRPISALHGTGVTALQAEEAGKFRLWVISVSFNRDELVTCPACGTPHWVDSRDEISSGATKVRCSNSNCRIRFCIACQVPWHSGMSCDIYQKKRSGMEASNALMAATAKQCPNCHSPVTHYHGHACHHIRGCPGCGCHFCYVCLRTEEENERVRGERARCVCEEGRWATFCKDEEILDYLELSPFPHDRRCGCPICPDCHRNAPCANCNGDCVVCKGVVQTGPTELHTYCIHETKQYYAKCLKDAGNALFAEKQYAAAAIKFTQAIALIPDAVFYSNKSACHAALEEWEQAAEDAKKCVEADKSFVKGYLRLAVALQRLDKRIEALDTVLAGREIDNKCMQLKKLQMELEKTGP